MPPAFPLRVLYGFQPFLRDALARPQASAIHLQAAIVTGVQTATATAIVSIGTMIVLRSEDILSIPC